MMVNELHKLQDFDVKNKAVIVRVDLNVPIIRGKVEDNTRITRIIPTLKYLLANNAKVILLSHFGRPKGKVVRDMSLAPLVDELSQALDGKEVKFGVDCTGEMAEKAVQDIEPGQIILMENVRFYPGEEKNDQDLAKELAKLGELYVNDTFSCSHRAHASVVAITKELPSAAGYLLQDELNNLENILSKPDKPIMAVIGGSKVSTKLELIYSLLKTMNIIVIGGAMANTFLKAQGVNIGQSLYEENLLDEANKIIASAKEMNCEIVLPVDVVVAQSITNHAVCKVVKIDNIPREQMILDLGPQTIHNIANKLADIKTLLWNGPVGAFEYSPFSISTGALARYVASLTNSGKLTSVIGGGDIVSAITNFGLVENFSYVSTGGGAFLEWLEGKTLPGVEALRRT